ncbi:MAG TPA: SRPBCC domain-containing protein [Candidatus Solibacter sp.]|nr:SRPBCC domain-containing protein [Candidatus Solibacter sp.]
MARTRPDSREVRLERSFDATVEEVWELWTTPEGIEAWWGPEGFDVKVRALDLRPDGEMAYVMTATAPDQVDFMRKAGMPLATDARLTFTEVDPPRRLAYSHLADFIPGVEPYRVATEVEIAATGGRVLMTVTIQAMHDEVWTDRAVKGWESQLGKLTQVLASGR